MTLRLSKRLLSSAAVAPPVSYAITGKRAEIALITLNRPHARNAVDADTADRLHEVFELFEADTSAKVGILHGANGTFCSGYDLKALGKAGAAAAAARLRPMGKGHGPMGPTRMALSKPCIAAVEGHAVAGGLELALLCDLRVVARSATFGVFCRRFGVPLIDGGTVRLPRLIGLSRAMDLMLTGRPVAAEEALQMGLANRVVDDGMALTAALELAAQIAQFPQECMNADRTSAYHAAYDAKSLNEALAFEFDHGMKVLKAESVPGARRFAAGEGRGGR